MDTSYNSEIIELLSSYFADRTDIAFAYLFGSAARKFMHPHSDVDVGVYFFPKSNELEIEDEIYYDEEDTIWADIDRLICRETDLLVLNRAPRQDHPRIFGYPV